MGGCQAEAVRIPMADGSLVTTPEQPDTELVPSLLTLSDVMGQEEWEDSGGLPADTAVRVVGLARFIR